MRPREDLASELKKNGYPDKLISIEGEEVQAELIYSGVIFFQRQKLDLACKCGCYNALKERSENNLKIIISENVSEENKSKAKKVLRNDLECLGSLYWTAGYMFAANILLSVALYYQKKGADYGSDAHAYFTEAATKYIRAKLLLNEELSISIRKIVNPIDTFAIYGITSTADGDGVFFKPIGDKKAQLIDSDERKKLNELLAKNRFRPQ